MNIIIKVNRNGLHIYALLWNLALTSTSQKCVSIRKQIIPTDNYNTVSPLADQYLITLQSETGSAILELGWHC